MKPFDKHAIGVDLNGEPLEWGKQHHLVKLSSSEKDRIQIFHKDVLAGGLPSCDLIAAMNFSFYLFKTRDELRKYFRSCYERLAKDGLLFTDCFGGSDRGSDYEERVEHRGFTYYWHQKDYDPVTCEANFSIHFKREGEKKRFDVFTYDWRMWSIPEIREIMKEAGFKKSIVLWEGTDRDGEGNGEFSPSEKGDDCPGWVAYVVGCKSA